MTRPLARRSTALALALLLLPAAALAQSPTVTGTVSDGTGAVLPGVSVQLISSAHPARETVTDAAGQYVMPAPAAGDYELRFSLVNFTRAARTVALTAGQARTVDVVLGLALTADVTVTGVRTFRNLADVEDPRVSLIGLAAAASEGVVTAQEVEGRPAPRPGDVLETIPGLVISQHSGEGKANQYYLRGFNLDHGTDFAVSVAGIPVNMPTHGHGQGWSDVNFLIPELVSGIQFKKGPYYAEEGDFSTAGAANISYVNALERPLVRATFGGHGFSRALAAASPRVGSGNLLLAIETSRYDGPWTTSEDARRVNVVARFSRGDARRGFAVTFMGYDAAWTATDQIPERAVRSGILPRFGSLDPSDGGDTHRYTLSAEVQRGGAASATRLVGFAMAYGLDLFSNFTYALQDPVNGDQFEQVDARRVLGLRSSHRRRARLFGLPAEHRFGGQVRHDRIGELGLFATRERQRLATVRQDRVHQTSTGVYYQGEVDLADTLRISGGLRADVYHFDVRSRTAANGGRTAAGIASPKLGLVFAPSRRLELYGNFGYGYHSNDARGATITIDPATGAPADRVTPLARTRGGEVGLRSLLVPGLQTTLAVWGLTLDSELVFVGDAGTTEAGRPSRRYGVEWANDYTPRPWLTLDADLSWSAAAFTDRDPIGAAIPGAVRRVAAAGVAVRELARFSGSLRLRHLGPRPLIEDASVAADGSFLVNAEAGYRLTQGMRIVLDVLNVFDASDSDVEYFYASRLPGEPLEGVDDRHAHPVAPRAARVALRVGF